MTPPDGMRFQRGSTGRYIMFAPWSRLPLGTVVKQRSQWVAYSRLGRRIAVRRTRAQAGKALSAWCWTKVPAEGKRLARKMLREEARV